MRQRKDLEKRTRPAVQGYRTLARALDVPESTVRGWAKQGAPISPDMSECIPAVVAWLREQRTPRPAETREYVRPEPSREHWQICVKCDGAGLAYKTFRIADNILTSYKCRGCGHTWKVVFQPKVFLGKSD